ncbi:unnamed protein product, partial [Nesidiocoris tenuis]
MNDFRTYCAKWNLTINLAKSKVMIFGKGGRRGRLERWSLGGEPVEIVASYKYLGVTMDSGLSYKSHFEERGLAAGVAVSKLWPLMSRSGISLQDKWKVFDATAKAVILYGAQAWGYREYELAERAQYQFVRRLFALPRHTPLYMLLLETGRSSLFLQALPLHVNFILRAMKLPETRLPNILVREGIRGQLPWLAQWRNLALSCGEEFDASWSVSQLSEMWQKLYTKLKAQERCTLLEKVGLSRFHPHYQLVFDPLSRPNYDASKQLAQIRWTFKARGGLLFLNFQPWRDELAQRCALCNSGSREDIVHFLAVCPILAEFRRRWFDVGVMAEADCLRMLRSPDFARLAGYCSEAWRYRVYKKSSPNNKLTLYLSTRDLVMTNKSNDWIQGVILADPEYVKNRK